MLCGRLALRMGDPEGSKVHLDAGLKAAEDGDPESYVALLTAMRGRACIIAGEDDEGRASLVEAESALEGLALPRRTQVLGVLALGYQALEDQEMALGFARQAAKFAGGRGFRLWSLVARSIVSVLAEGSEAKSARDEATAIAEQLCKAMPPELRPVFQQRPRVRALLHSVETSDPEQDLDIGDPE